MQIKDMRPRRFLRWYCDHTNILFFALPSYRNETLFVQKIKEILVGEWI